MLSRHLREIEGRNCRLIGEGLVVVPRKTGKHVDETSYAVYQRIGNVLSGVYSFGANTKAQQAFVLHAAEQSAKILRSKGAGGPTA